jgi:adenylosuccinate lyase
MPKPDHDAERVTYQSPLSQRYASPAMQALWGERRRIGLWRRLWLALMEAQQELGLDIPKQAVAELRAHLDDVDLDRVAEHEKRLRHDVMAHIHQLGEQAPAARPFLHLGATSAYVTDNADLILMREGMVLLLGRVAAVLVALGHLARRHRALPCLAYTHFQPAQLTTVGKRITMWMQDFLLDAEELLHRLETLQFRGVKGTTGTQASFVELFGGNESLARELDTRVAQRMGFARVFPITGQTYTRKLDAQILAVLSGIAASAAKFATDLRLLQHEGELLEPFESDQVGSSAMAYKRNPMRAERMTGLARFVIELEGNAWHTAAEQWLERTLDDSANRRLVLPDAFLTSDAILILATNVAAGLEVREAVIARHVTLHMPFLATERLLMRGVKAGGDRQRLHEVIRTHALLAAQATAEQGAPNDVLERLARDPAFKALRAALEPSELDPAAYVGRAPQQVEEFLDHVVPALLRRVEAVAPAAAPAEVTV